MDRQQNHTMLFYGDLAQQPSQPLPRTYRASNDDRHQIIEQLQAHYVAGRLGSSELESRVERALAAVTLADLDVVVADLPTLDSAQSGATEQPRSRADRREHRRKSRSEKPFRAHATTYLLVVAMLVIIWALTTPGGYFWPVWPMFGLGIGLVAHGLAARNHHSAAVGYQ